MIGTNKMFEFDMWIIGPDNEKYWYTRCSSLEYINKAADRFTENTDARLYKLVFITFTFAEYAHWEVGKEYNGSLFKDRLVSKA